MMIGFKEWLGVCSHLGAGSFSLLLRKGGIHEGRAGFSFKHENFFLFPTGFHDSENGLQVPPPEAPVRPATEENGVSLWLYAEAEFAELVRDRAVVEALAPHHVWTPQVVADRFNYSEKLEADCLSVAFVRVFRLPEPWSFPYEARFGGCRSWIDLPDPPTGWRESLVPVIDEDEHARRREAIRQVLGSP